MPVASGQGKWPVTYGVTREATEPKKDARCAICVQKHCFIVSGKFYTSICFLSIVF